ncbi:TetR/AcrR family transcriptional regulator [Anaeromicropila herbilytica]|uniref:TetR family transcriptional regulator n=1 Tax=Anaeromicropila herbilytica TaxID=2785025 RepID=A0A7R7EKG0_9FIRM|nr:TetR/AcrR family transcriptional regulator [Anaeromicropila herbilytica]BCN30521.1 TetR family transcriptional regulator [Anaeromicropila herbilytica]
MTVKNRREREKEEMRELILSTASDLIAIEGLEKLSIRKIASEIEYAPSVIYHYFKDKEEILNIIMQRGYSKITSAVGNALVEPDSPEEKLKKITREYIEVALSMPDQFLVVQLNGSPEVLKHTGFLFQGASKEKPALATLYECLKELYQDKEVEEDTIELTAQIIAASTLGLIIKLIKEKDISDEQRERLINFYTNEIVLRVVVSIK